MRVGLWGKRFLFQSLQYGGLILVAALVMGWAGSPIVGAQEGLPWTEPSPISPSMEKGRHPVLTADNSGMVYALWFSQFADGGVYSEAILYARYGSEGWTKPADVLLSPSGQQALFLRAIVDDSGRMHAFWSTAGDGPWGPLYHSWAAVGAADAATGWTEPVEIAAGTYGHDVALDAQGRLHVVYASVLDNRGICHLESTDRGHSWNETSCIPPADFVRDEEHEVKPRLAVDSKGGLHVVWVLDDYSPLSWLAYSGRAVFYARSVDGGSSWFAAQAVDEVDSRDRAYEGAQPEWGHVVVDQEDRIHIIWVGSPDMQRYHQYSDDGGVRWSPRQVAIPSGGYDGWCGTAVDSAGVLHLACPSLGGMEYTQWTGSGWSPAQGFDGTRGAHLADAIVVLGNNLHVVWQNHGGGPRVEQARVMHAMTQTGSIGIEPQVLSTAVPPVQPTPTTTHPQTVVPSPAPTPQPSPVHVEPPQPLSDRNDLLWLAILPAVGVVGAVVLVFSLKLQRHR